MILTPLPPNEQIFPILYTYKQTMQKKVLVLIKKFTYIDFHFKSMLLDTFLKGVNNIQIAIKLSILNLDFIWLQRFPSLG